MILRMAAVAALLSGASGVVPTPADAEGWAMWDVAGTRVAGFCSPAADETCLEVSCSDDGQQFAVVALGAWSVTMGDRQTVTVTVDSETVQTVDGTIEEAKGYGPEFFALRGDVSEQTVEALSNGSEASLVYEDGYVLGGFSLTGSGAALSKAGC